MIFDYYMNMRTWTAVQFVLLLALAVVIFARDDAGFHHGRQAREVAMNGLGEDERALPCSDASEAGAARKDRMLRVRRDQERGGSDNMPAVPRTASSITQPTASTTTDEEATAAPPASMTPPPSLAERQEIPLDPLGTISSLSQSIISLSSSAASAIASVSASASLVQQSASNAVQSAQSSASSAISSASSSASSAMASLSASASSAASSAANSAASSASMALSSAWRAVESASRDVQSARVELATVRAQANDQLQQAQGAVVSVTQAALGIVGAIIGSSILSILAFYCVLRWRRQKKRQQMALAINRKPSIGYPQPSPMNGLDPSEFVAAPTRTVSTPRKLQSVRARSMTSNSAPPRVSRIDAARASRGPELFNNSVPPTATKDGGLHSPGGTTALGYATSDYGSGNWPGYGPPPGSANTNAGIARTPSSTSSAPNFSRRHTRAESTPTNEWAHRRSESGPSVVDSTFTPGHTRAASSTSTLGGPGVGNDMRSPLRRNVVSLFPRPRDGGGMIFVRPDDRVSASGGMKDAPLPVPPSFDRIDRLSRVSEEPGHNGQARLSVVPSLELKGSGKVSPFQWPYDKEGKETAV